MKIRNSTNNDLTRIMEIYAHARKFMAEHGNPNQWGPTNWPPEWLIKEDIEKGCRYVCESDNGIVIGTFFFNQGKEIEPNYIDIEDGNWSHEQVTKLEEKAVGQIKKDAEKDGILDKATQSGVKKLTDMFKTFGFSVVNITIEGQTVEIEEEKK